MIVITNIEQTKKGYTLFFDNDEKLLVSAETLSEFFLYNGKELSSKDLTKIKEYEAQNKHFNYAVNLLANRQYTSHEIRVKLRKREINEEVIELIVQRLKALNLIDDLRYAIDKITYLSNVRHYSKRAIENDLLRRGVHPYTISDAFNANPVDERKELEIKIPKLIKTYKNESVRGAYKKVKGRLFSLGFKASNIDEVLSEYDFNDYINEEENIIKALTKLEKKGNIDPKVLYNKLITSGYPTSLVCRTLEDYKYEN